MANTRKFFSDLTKPTKQEVRVIYIENCRIMAEMLAEYRDVQQGIIAARIAAGGKFIPTECGPYYGDYKFLKEQIEIISKEYNIRCMDLSRLCDLFSK